jgi:putative ABC transport system substrate-binding protein
MAGNTPIVSMSGDPVIAGFVTSLARPGGHITGVSMMTGISGLTGKRIELLKEALPNAVRIGVIFNPDFPVAVASMAEAQEVVGQQGLILLQAPVRRFDEIDPAVQTLVRDNVHAVYVEAISPFTDYERETGELLLRYRIPAVSELYLLIKTGGLISYGPNQFNAVRRLGYFVDRILKGANPADLPVEQASKFELMINMRTAKLLDIKLPPVLLARADEVVE